MKTAQGYMIEENECPTMLPAISFSPEQLLKMQEIAWFLFGLAEPLSYEAFGLVKDGDLYTFHCGPLLCK